MHNAFCVSWKRRGEGTSWYLIAFRPRPRRPFLLSASSLLANSRHVYLMSLLDSLHCIDYCSTSVLSPCRWPKQGRALSDAVTMTTSILSAPFWFRAPKTRFICKVWPSIIELPTHPHPPNFWWNCHCVCSSFELITAAWECQNEFSFNHSFAVFRRHPSSCALARLLKWIPDSNDSQLNCAVKIKL